VNSVTFPAGLSIVGVVAMRSKRQGGWEKGGENQEKGEKY
jgi:hypothetical protein